MKLPVILRGDAVLNRIVPPSGYTASLTVFTAAAMAFLAVFAMAMALAADDLATRWEAELAGTATIRLTAPDDRIEAQTDAVLQALEQTPGIQSARRVTEAEQVELLAPWFGTELPIEALRLPVLIEIVETSEGPDRTGLEQRLAAEAPGAVYDSHGRWRMPLIEAAGRLRQLALISLCLIALVTGATIALAASTALAANAGIVDVLRLVGARDRWIAKAFVLRFTLRTLGGGALGAFAGTLVVALVPNAVEAGVLGGIGFDGLEWLWPFLVPVAAAMIALVATLFAARRQLRKAT